MKQFLNLESGDVITVTGVIADYYAALPEWRLISEEEIVAHAPLELGGLTVGQLREYAEAEGIDISRSDLKNDIINKLKGMTS